MGSGQTESSVHQDSVENEHFTVDHKRKSMEFPAAAAANRCKSLKIHVTVQKPGWSILSEWAEAPRPQRNEILRITAVTAEEEEALIGLGGGNTVGWVDVRQRAPLLQTPESKWV